MRTGGEPARFSSFVAIDWSGAAGERHKGIALAHCRPGTGAPQLVRPGHRWSRSEVLQWLETELPANALVGMDLSGSLPFADAGSFFPGWDDSPATARDLWAMVENICTKAPHLGAGPFVDHPVTSRYFRRHGGRQGDLFGIGRGRLRVTEFHQSRQGCNPYSNFNLVGAAQVGKSSLTGMRLLHRLDGSMALWPFDPVPATGSVLVEIYTTIAAMAGGRRAGRAKMRCHAELDEALVILGSRPIQQQGAIDDHSSDAIVASAWLRKTAENSEFWAPKGMTEKIAATEGWTFGVT